MVQPVRSQLEPWVVLAGYFMFSTTAFLYVLNPLESQKAADTLSRLVMSSSPAAYQEAKQVSNHMLNVILQDSVATFFLINCMTSTAALTWIATKVVFLGQLTVIETNKLTERLLMYVMLKVVFFGAAVNPTYRDVGTWILWFFVMGYLKMFVGLAGDRCEALLSSPTSTPFQHLRCLALLMGILVHMSGWLVDYVWNMKEGEPWSSAALWLFDGVTVVVEATHGTIKYGVHAVERWRAARAEKRGEDGAGPWEWQGSFLFHVELVADLLLHSLTMAHYLHLWVMHGLRFQLVDMLLALDVRYLGVVIVRRLRGYRRYRRLTKLVHSTFPCAASHQLEDEQCAICMERMKSAKVLPCGHVFHLPCLQAWLQQSRTGSFSCPMCRASLLVEGFQEGGGTTDEAQRQRQAWPRHRLQVQQGQYTEGTIVDYLHAVSRQRQASGRGEGDQQAPQPGAPSTSGQRHARRGTNASVGPAGTLLASLLSLGGDREDSEGQRGRGGRSVAQEGGGGGGVSGERDALLREMLHYNPELDADGDSDQAHPGSHLWEGYVSASSTPGRRDSSLMSAGRLLAGMLAPHDAWTHEGLGANDAGRHPWPGPSPVQVDSAGGAGGARAVPGATASPSLEGGEERQGQEQGAGSTGRGWGGMRPAASTGGLESSWAGRPRLVAGVEAEAGAGPGEEWQGLSGGRGAASAGGPPAASQSGLLGASQSIQALGRSILQLAVSTGPQTGGGHGGERGKEEGDPGEVNQPARSVRCVEEPHAQLGAGAGIHRHRYSTRLQSRRR